MPVTLPWRGPAGRSETAWPVFSTRERTALDRTYFNRQVWKPALKAADVPASRDNGMRALRHHYASVVLEGRVNIRALADLFGHDNPGFSLRVYADLMPALETGPGSRRPPCPAVQLAVATEMAARLTVFPRVATAG